MPNEGKACSLLYPMALQVIRVVNPDAPFTDVVSVVVLGGEFLDAGPVVITREISLGSCS